MPNSRNRGLAVALPPAGSISLPALIVPRLLRIQDAASYLSATTWFVETLIRERRIPSMIVGKRRVIDVNDLDEWIDEQKKAQAATEVCGVTECEGKIGLPKEDKTWIDPLIARRN
jgi:excisionase family DNA binding protein